MLNINLKTGLFIIGIFIIAVACKKKSDDRENAFIANEKTFSTPNGYLEVYSPEEDGGDFDVVITDGEYFSDSSDFYNWSSLVYFDFKSPSTEELSSGEYFYNIEWPPNSFVYAEVAMYGNYGVTFEVTDGTVIINKSGDTYEISYDLTMGRITTVNGYFKGTLEEIDHTQ